MEQRTARLTFLVDPNKKVAFERLCAQLDLTPSQVVRQLIRDDLKERGVEYETRAEGTQPVAPKAPPAAKRSPVRRET
jgi:antitoxin component of RelBE/YafQ-DinJ toxin-antitoxin module